MSTVRQIPEIDGLRAVAILTVVLFHAGLPGMTGGYIGVDVFFVISGFLITRLLVDEFIRAGTINILDFYARRVRRQAIALARAIRILRL
jgi:peptidoglycan/LPS O-acetylase OafA/YrhL